MQVRVPTIVTITSMSANLKYCPIVEAKVSTGMGERMMGISTEVSFRYATLSKLITICNGTCHTLTSRIKTR